MENETLNLCGPPPKQEENELTKPALNWIRKEKEKAELKITEILEELERQTGVRIHEVALREITACNVSTGRVQLTTQRFAITLSV